MRATAPLERELTPNELDGEEAAYPHGLKLAVILAALCLAVFLVALDQTIIATAIPKITDQFNSIQDIGWYGSAYLLTTTALQPTFGRIYTIFSVSKKIYTYRYAARQLIECCRSNSPLSWPLSSLKSGKVILWIYGCTYELTNGQFSGLRHCTKQHCINRGQSHSWDRSWRIVLGSDRYSGILL